MLQERNNYNVIVQSGCDRATGEVKRTEWWADDIGEQRRHDGHE